LNGGITIGERHKTMTPGMRFDTTTRLERAWRSIRVLRESICVVASFAVLGLTGCQRSGSAIAVIYTSQDQVYAEVVLRQFTRETGIEVRPVFDSEAVKTVGLVNRLIAEARHPQCDVFWNNEELRTRQLAARNIFREEHPWQAMGFRTRRLVINTNLVLAGNAPQNLTDLTNAHWRGKIALAYPLFGTTATHFLALRQHWGEARWADWCRALLANKPLVVDGNSVVVKLVARGEASVGLTDSDDIAAGQREGFPVAALPLWEESLAIPNTIAIIRGAPHPEAARKLFEYLQSADVVNQLVAAHALEGASVADLKASVLQPSWDKLIADLPGATETLQKIFLR
jgi:iron(III) transport system substrate-binding protein